MEARGGQLFLQVHGDGLADDELADDARALRLELLDRDLEAVRPVESGAAPEGAKGDALAWTQLAVGFSGGLPTLVQMIQSWLTRRPGRKIVLELEGDRLELTDPSFEDERQLIDAWLDRHSTRDG